MKFAAIIEYAADLEIDCPRPADAPAVSDRVAGPRRTGLHGPFTDDSGALIVYEAADVAAAEELLKADPFHAAGVFVAWKLRPWRPVMANPALLPGG